MGTKTAITTIDNPINPIVDYYGWRKYDEEVLGYYSSAYLARIVRDSDSFTDKETDEEIERAIDEIVLFHPTLYKKVKSKDDA